MARKSRWRIALFALLLSANAALALELKPDDRLLVLAPHPDDEVIACAGVIQDAVRMKLPVRVVFLTNGDANEWSFTLHRKYPALLPAALRRMGVVRQSEAVKAAGVLGLQRTQLTFLGYPDNRTLAIWREGWGSAPAKPGFLTRVRAVPYPEALRPGAPYKGEEILADLKTVLSDFKPTKLLVSHPADDNVDHRALYLFTRVALWDLAGQVQPAVHPYMVHYRNWKAGTFPKLADEKAQWASAELEQQDIERKRQALLAHRTQYRSRPGYLMSFVRGNEVFGAVGQESATGRYGIESRTVRREGDDLLVRIEFARPEARAVNAYVSLFGHRADQPFARLPKIRACLEGSDYTIFDQRQRLRNTGCTVKHDADEIMLRVPLKLLGNPERLLLSIQTRFSEVPADAAAWRVIELPAASPLTES